MNPIDTRLMAYAVSLKGDTLTLRRVVRVPVKRGDYHRFTAYYAEEFTAHTDGVFTLTTPSTIARYTRTQHALARLDLYSGQHDTVLIEPCDSDYGILPRGTVVREITPCHEGQFIHCCLPKLRQFVIAKTNTTPRAAIDSIPLVYTRKAI